MWAGLEGGMRDGGGLGEGGMRDGGGLGEGGMRVGGGLGEGGMRGGGLGEGGMRDGGGLGEGGMRVGGGLGEGGMRDGGGLAASTLEPHGAEHRRDQRDFIINQGDPAEISLCRYSGHAPASRPTRSPAVPGIVRSLCACWIVRSLCACGIVRSLCACGIVRSLCACGIVHSLCACRLCSQAVLAGVAVEGGFAGARCQSSRWQPVERTTLHSGDRSSLQLAMTLPPRLLRHISCLPGTSQDTALPAQGQNMLSCGCLPFAPALSTPPSPGPSTEAPSLTRAESRPLGRHGATKDMGKMLGGEEEKDPDAQKKEEERQEALRQQEEERKAKHARMEAEREKVRQTIRDKEKEAEEKAAMEQACEGSLTRPKKAIPAGCGDEEDEDEESILDTVLKFLPGPLQDMFKK
ncbi:hypothetical protein JZ751_019155 [Albula glossodonta]|uniref:Complexin-2 n=1 Tax=Albula glossodonta TaxID=121402 RepID=A0A8T2N0L9_9TELE|nr:hypothetical protein JZ751_019155 [Albula glossodonta]